VTWAKIDTALHRNPKVRMAGREARDVYLFVVLANADTGADGELNSMILDPEYLADQLQCSVEDATRGVKRCETFHLLHVTGSIVAICGWDDEWKVKNSTDRVRKHRNQKKQAVAADETLRNVTDVTVTNETPREIDREIDREIESIAQSALERFDFESAYADYPRKQGKAKGLTAARRIITTPEDFEKFTDCITFMSRAFRSKDAKQFCPHFSTFVNAKSWRDEEWPGSDRVTTSPGKLTPGQLLDQANGITA
jgi:hypothetical protein